MSTPVSFKMAKLLKEKGYSEPVMMFYELALKSRKDRQDGYGGPFGYKKGELNLQDGFFVNNSKSSDLSNKAWFLCSAPTFAQVLMWLYDKHGIWIVPQPFVKINKSVVWLYDIFKDNYIVEQLSPSKGTNTHTEAYEAAIEYTLNNLI